MNQIMDYIMSSAFLHGVFNIAIIWLPVFVFVFIINRFMKRLENNKDISPNKQSIFSLLGTIARYSVYFIGIFSTLEAFGISLTPLLAIGSAIGVAVGLGAQEVVKDVLAGFMILFENQFVLGDHVKLEGYEGEVVNISLLSTTIQHLITKELHSIPNGKIGIVTNYSRTDTVAIVDYLIPYELNVQEVLEKMAVIFKDVHYDGMLAGVVINGIQMFDNTGIQVRITAACQREKQVPLQRMLRLHGLEALKEEGIHVPHPTVSINQAL